MFEELFNQSLLFDMIIEVVDLLRLVACYFDWLTENF